MILKMDGCGSRCAQQIHSLKIQDIISYHSLFHDLPTHGKKQWLLDYFKMNTPSSGETIYLVCGQPVCFPIWVNTLGLSRSYYYKIYSLFKSGIIRGNSEVIQL